MQMFAKARIQPSHAHNATPIAAQTSFNEKLAD